MTADPSPSRSHDITVTLSPHDATAGLLRLVSVLHGRGADIVDLRYRRPDSESARVSARIELPPSRLAHVCAAMSRSLHVRAVESHEPSSGSSGGRR